MSKVYVVPAPGGRIRQPERRFRVMPPEGDFVPRDAHYERLILSGDVIVTDPPNKKPARKADKPSAAVKTKPETTSEA